jgi:hypothetical protein
VAFGRWSVKACFSLSCSRGERELIRPYASCSAASLRSSEGGAAVLNRDHIVRTEERSAAGTLQIREVPQIDVIWEGHQAIAAQLPDWLDGGPPPATTLADNLQSTAMRFAAIRASESGMTVDVQEIARELGERNAASRFTHGSRPT